MKEDAEFAKVRELVMERDHWSCQFPDLYLDGWLKTRLPCISPIDPHHLVPVARDKTLRLDPDNLKALCRRHHDWVHDHPAEATALGLLRSAPGVSLGSQT